MKEEEEAEEGKERRKEKGDREGEREECGQALRDKSRQGERNSSSIGSSQRIVSCRGRDRDRGKCETQMSNLKGAPSFC